MKYQKYLMVAFLLVSMGCSNTSVKKSEKASVRNSSERIAEIFQRKSVGEITKNIGLGLSEIQMEQVKRENH